MAEGFEKLDLTETEELAHLTQHLGHLLRFGRRSDKRCKTFNSGVQRILEVASNNDGIEEAKLHGIMKVGDDKFQKALGTAKDEGYVTESDGKVAITDAGKKAYEDQKAADKEIADRLFNALSADEQKQLEALYKKLVSAWHANDEQ